MSLGQGWRHSEDKQCEYCGCTLEENVKNVVLWCPECEMVVGHETESEVEHE